jgi:hypothetical protein
MSNEDCTNSKCPYYTPKAVDHCRAEDVEEMKSVNCKYLVASDLSRLVAALKAVAGNATIRSFAELQEGKVEASRMHDKIQLYLLEIAKELEGGAK